MTLSFLPEFGFSNRETCRFSSLSQQGLKASANLVLHLERKRKVFPHVMHHGITEMEGVCHRSAQSSSEGRTKGNLGDIQMSLKEN